MNPDEQERLTRLEREVAILRAEFAKLREHVRVPNAARAADYKAPPPADAQSTPPRPVPPPEPARPRPVEDILTAPPPRKTFEQVIGHYVIPGVATLLVLIAFSIFLSWAIRKGLLGPTARVVLGYAGALAIAFAGVRLRMRGTREYGNILLAIALGVVHLVCWAAGPRLHVLPSGVALGIGFLASVLLAEFALRHEEEMLCAVGFGGAAIAPFVAGDSDGNRIALALYGIVVVALGAAALGARQWKYARGITMWSVILYTAMSGAGHPSESPPAWIAARLWVLTPALMALAVIPFTHAAHRRSMIRVSAAGLIMGALLRADQWNADLASVLITLAGTVIILGALDLSRPGALEREASEAVMDQRLIDRDALLDAFLIPVGLFVATVAAAPRLDSFESAVVAIVFAAGAVYLTHRTRGEPEGDKFASTASLIALWIVPAAFIDQDLARVAGCAVMAIVLLQAARRLARLPFVLGAIGSVIFASVFAVASLEDRLRYEYIPFATWPSIAALIAVVGWIACMRLVAPPDFLPELAPKLRASLREAFITGAAATAFFWGRAELAWAWSTIAATSLLIVYYAATGALMIFFGRKYAVRHLRLIGLGLALWAAWKALIEAFGLPNVAVRIAVFSAVALFLIGIGYWYSRGAGDGDVDGSVSPVAGV